MTVGGRPQRLLDGAPNPIRGRGGLGGASGVGQDTNGNVARAGIELRLVDLISWRLPLETISNGPTLQRAISDTIPAGCVLELDELQLRYLNLTMPTWGAGPPTAYVWRIGANSTTLDNKTSSLAVWAEDNPGDGLIVGFTSGRLGTLRVWEGECIQVFGIGDLVDTDSTGVLIVEGRLLQIVPQDD